MARLWKMVLEEPFRVFFPLGMLAGVYGVLMWPLHYGHYLSFNPIDAHPRMMVGGMVGAFMAGFLGTAFPRLVGSRRWTSAEFLALLGCWAMVTISAARGAVAESDAWFAALALGLLVSLMARWIAGHRDTPPPGFPLALVGLLGGAAGAACLAWDHGRWMGAEAMAWAKLAMYQGFTVLPVMGVGPYLLPRYFGHPSSHAFDDSPVPPPGWWARAGSGLFWGGHIVAGFWLEVAGWPQIGQLLRGVVILVWFLRETPVFKPAATPSTAGNLVRAGVICIAAGWLASAFLPQARVGNLHLLFVGGIGMFLAVASVRVVLGHAGRHDLLGGKRNWLRWLAVLIVLAATTRMSADLIEKVKTSHHIYAAWTWVAVAALWFAALGRHLWRDGEDHPPVRKSRCPRRKS